MTPEAVQQLTLADAIAIAVAHNPSVDAVALRETIASIGATRARLDRYSAKIETTAGLAGGAFAPWQGDPYSTSGASWGAHAVGSVPLYAGGAIDATIDRADLDVKISALDTAITQRDIVRATYVAYWNVRGIDLRIAATEEGIGVTEDALHIMQARADNLLAATLDVNRSTVQLYAQQGDLLDAQQQRVGAEQDLIRLLHLDVDHVDLIDDPPVPVEGDVVLPDGAGADRPELARLDHQAAQAAADVTIAKAGLLPTVALQGRAGAGADAVGGGTGVPIPKAPLDPNDLGPSFDATAGITATWDPFDLRRTRDAVAQARVSESIVEKQQESEKDSLDADIKTAAGRVEHLRLQVPLATKQVELARDDLSIVQELYAQGSIGILELFDAQSSFRQARIAEATLRVDLALAEIDLKWQLGQDLVGATR